MLDLYSSRAGAGGGSLSRRDETFWIDLLQPTDEERARVAREFGVHVPTRAQLEEIESSSRLRAEADVLYLSMPLAGSDGDDALVPPPLGLILSPRVLVTVRYSEVRAFAEACARARKGENPGSQAVFASLVEAMVDYAADVLEKWSGDLAGLSRQVFDRTTARAAGRGARWTRRPRPLNRMLGRMLNSVGTAGDHLSRIRESLLGLTRIVGYVPEAARDWLLPDIGGRLHTARQDLASLADFEAHLSGKTQFLLDAILGFINIEQNDTFKVLTIASVVGIPPTLIASMYGMNFHNMPELSWRWGYEYGLGVIALSTIVPILWFKWRGWW
jgi:magnesium transporter